MNPTVLMDKAARAVASAKLRLDAGDVDGACNRAYYAMFDAAKAALIGSGVSVEPTVLLRLAELPEQLIEIGFVQV